MSLFYSAVLATLFSVKHLKSFSFSSRFAISSVLVAGCLLAACGEDTAIDPDSFDFDDAAVTAPPSTPSVDASSWGGPGGNTGWDASTVDTGVGAFPDSGPGAAPVFDSSVPVNPENPVPDAGEVNLDDLIGGLFGGGDTDGGSSAPVGDPGKGELDPNGAINPQLPPKADNPKECPSLAPPSPVGNCLGLPIYVICGYGSDGGPQYTCTCDWFHWLCI